MKLLQMKNWEKKGKEIMTKYLTPKVRGYPNPTAGVGGLMQEYGPPGLC